MDFSAARRNMVESQVRPNQVTDDRVIAALEEVPREAFVPEAFKGIAYIDEDIGIGNGRTILAPMVFARLLQAAQLDPAEIVLDVGCGTGYSAAVLARLASTVIALESDRALMQRAQTLLADQGADNVALVEGPLAEGDKAHGPYNAIIVEGAVARLPDALLAQLADLGRLVAVTARPGEVSRATLTLRVGDSFTTRPLFDASATMLPGFAVRPGFVF